MSKLALERQSFFNHKFDLERDILEKEDLLGEKEIQIAMMKSQLKILSDEIDDLKEKQQQRISLIPTNLVKKIRGGGGTGIY